MSSPADPSSHDLMLTVTHTYTPIPNRELLPDDKALGDFLMKHSRAALGPNGERTYFAK